MYFTLIYFALVTLDDPSHLSSNVTWVTLSTQIVYTLGLDEPFHNYNTFVHLSAL